MTQTYHTFNSIVFMLFKGMIKQLTLLCCRELADSHNCAQMITSYPNFKVTGDLACLIRASTTPKTYNKLVCWPASIWRQQTKSTHSLYTSIWCYLVLSWTSAAEASPYQRNVKCGAHLLMLPGYFSSNSCLTLLIDAAAYCRCGAYMIHNSYAGIASACAQTLQKMRHIRYLLYT